jgi:hypothetical protein
MMYRNQGELRRASSRALILAFLVLEAPSSADDAQRTWTIPVCSAEKAQGKRIGRLRYIVPKHAIVKKFRDVDYGGYRVFLNKQGKWEVLSLLWEVNGSPYSLCSAERHRLMRLPDGTEGTDTRCTSSTDGGDRQSRSTGFMAEYAYYRGVSPDSAKYFDAIIDSMCYEPPNN